MDDWGWGGGNGTGRPEWDELLEQQKREIGRRIANTEDI